MDGCFRNVGKCLQFVTALHYRRLESSTWQRQEWHWHYWIQSLEIMYGTVKPRFTNASDHEYFGLRTNFPNTKRLGWRTVSRVTNTQAVPRDRKKKKNPLPNNNISLPHHLPLTPSTLLLITFHLRRQLSSSPLSTYAVNSPPHHLPLTPSTPLHTGTVKLN